MQADSSALTTTSEFRIFGLFMIENMKIFTEQDVSSSQKKNFWPIFELKFDNSTGYVGLKHTMVERNWCESE